MASSTPIRTHPPAEPAVAQTAKSIVPRLQTEDRTCLIATLGTEPQVVTLALQALTDRGEAVHEVVVLHTAPREPRIGAAIARLDAAFAGEPRLAAWRGHYRRVTVEGQAGPVADMLVEEDFGAVLAALYRLVRDRKQAAFRVHLNVSGGRKLMSL